MQVSFSDNFTTFDFETSQNTGPRPFDSNSNLNFINADTQSPQCRDNVLQLLHTSSVPRSVFANSSTDQLGNDSFYSPLQPSLASEDSESATTSRKAENDASQALMDTLKAHPRHIEYNLVLEQQRRIRNLWPSVTKEAFGSHSDFCRLYQQIKAYDLPNFLGAQITLDSALNLDMWDHLLNNYHDKELCVFLRYGWPVGYDAKEPPTSVDSNHQSAKRNLPHVVEFIKTELSNGALVGPFKSPPFAPWTRVSPLLTRPKKDSVSRRIIVDLSYPEGSAVNTGININSVYGRDLSYTLPNISDFTTILKSLGPGALMWKADLSRAYRQLRIDPLDCPLLAIQVNGQFYVDLCPSFGCRTSSAACQRLSNAISYLMGLTGCHLLAYLDDYAAAASTIKKASADYEHFLKLANDLGLQLAINKCQPPTTRIEWQGFMINSTNMTVSIPKAKLNDILADCKRWKQGSRISKQSLQSLIGKLIHLTNGISHGRKFTTRLLATLRGMKDRTWTTITKEASFDIQWFLNFAAVSNGISVYASPVPDFIIECDACLSGAGGHSGTEYYIWRYDDGHSSKYGAIHRLEAINLLVAFRTLTTSPPTPGSHVQIFTDNISSAYSLMSGKTKDQILGACARQMWLEAAKRDQTFIISHKPGAALELADALSRYHTDSDKKSYVLSEVRVRGLAEVEPVLCEYVFFDHTL